MGEQKQLEEMGLGELVNVLVTLKDEFRGRIVDENHPRPETWEKYGGIHAYNEGIRREYKHRREVLILELNKREQSYSR
ncbi:MAG: hypothetical protein ABIH65_00355 [Nanoarchaeota archaeon]